MSELRLAAGAVLALALIGFAAAAAAAEPKPGCEYQPIDLDLWGGAEWRDVTPVRSRDGYLDTTLTTRYGEHRIAGCPTRLRLYGGELVGPTLRVAPGDTLEIELVNHLPLNPPRLPPYDPNIPHDFNTTNLHTHGLHVSPAGNADNVLLRIDPEVTLQYEIKLPRDHPPGTFWYHPHVHGSTAIQVGSGMAGALIVEGGLDRVTEIAAARERIFVFQQIPYDRAGRVEDFDESFGPGKWAEMKRRTTINGQLYPTIRMRPGAVERWRFIHGGVRETLMVALEGHQLHEIAVDGLATGRIDTWDTVELQPGYRSDVMVQALPLPPGTTRMEYLLVDRPSSAELSLLQVAEERAVLAKVVVEGQPVRLQLPRPEQVAGLVPFPWIEETRGEQTLVFDIDTSVEPARFLVNGRPFGNDHRRLLELGRAETWNLRSDFASHPFHIHVNPFQHERRGPDGRPQRVWRDTLLLREKQPETVRTRYSRYVGTFVLHCHILDHEDQGMMELVEVRPPGQSNQSSDHH